MQSFRCILVTALYAGPVLLSGIEHAFGQSEFMIQLHLEKGAVDLAVESEKIVPGQSVSPASEAVDPIDGTTGDASSTSASAEGPDASAPEDILYRIDLGNLQEEVNQLLNRTLVYEDCGDQISVSNVEFSASDGEALICGEISYQSWTCHRAQFPEFKGLSVTFRDKIVGRSKIFAATDTICFNMLVGPSEDGKDLVFQARRAGPELLPAVEAALAGERTDIRFADMLSSRFEADLWGEDISAHVKADAGSDYVIDGAQFEAGENGVLSLEITGK